MNKYLSLITSEYQNSPKFIALVDLLTSAIASNTLLIQSFQTLFDVDTAVGQQLDYTGQWIGLTRYISPKVTTAFFSWDGDGSVGWERGYWQGKYSDQGITTLNDSEYRRLLYAKIALNQWDGSIPSAQTELSLAFPQNNVYIMDHQDMTMDVAVSGSLTPLVQSLLTRGHYDCRPCGVLVNKYWMSSIIDTPIFAWDENTTLLAGWDIGAYATTLTPS